MLLKYLTSKQIAHYLISQYVGLLSEINHLKNPQELKPPLQFYTPGRQNNEQTNQQFQTADCKAHVKHQGIHVI